MMTPDDPTTRFAAPPPAGDASLPAPPRRRLSPRALAARRANIARAHAADKDLTYRATERRRAASLANIQKAIAWRRSPEGNARARLNALKHGLNAVQLGAAGEKLDEAFGNLSSHRARVRRIFRPEAEEEVRLVERLARASWRRIQLFRGRARYEEAAWRKFGKRAGKLPHIAPEDFCRRAIEISRLLFRAHQMETETLELEMRIDRILKALLRARGRGEGARG